MKALVAAKLQGSASQATRDRQAEALADFRARRVHRRLEELEVGLSYRRTSPQNAIVGVSKLIRRVLQRTNPTDIPASSFVPTSSVNGQAGPGGSAASKKKQSGNVRKILYARKSLNDWIEELVSPRLRSKLCEVVRRTRSS